MPRFGKSTAVPLKRSPSGQLASGRSKTGDPQCSQAMSAWVRGRKTGMVSAAVYAMLGVCRAKAHQLRQGQLAAAAGNPLKAQALTARAQRGMSGKARQAKADQLRAQRKSKITSSPAGMTSKPNPIKSQVTAARQARGLVNPAERSKHAQARAEERADRNRGRAATAKALAGPSERERTWHPISGVEIKGEPGNAPHARISLARFTAERKAKAQALMIARMPARIPPKSSPAKAPSRAEVNRAVRSAGRSSSDDRNEEVNRVLGSVKRQPAPWQVAAGKVNRTVKAAEKAPKGSAPKVEPAKPAVPTAKGGAGGHEHVVAKLRHIQEHAALDSNQINEHVAALGLHKMSAGELSAVQKDFLGAAVGSGKARKIESIKIALSNYARSKQRAESIRSY
jgi:hypothetical protein